MKIICISDTHLGDIKISQSGSLIIHCGDCTCRGNENELKSFLNWFSSLNFDCKIMIPGNHDFIFENNWNYANSLCEEKGIICLNDSGIEINKIKIWGSPITPYFKNWAFNRQRGEEIQKHWDQIPLDTNILVTHGPPSGVGDLSKVIKNCQDLGCKNLKQTVDKIKPKYHLFGHIHEGYGIYKGKDTTFINCSVMNSKYDNVNEPVEFYYERY